MVNFILKRWFLLLSVIFSAISVHGQNSGGIDLTEAVELPYWDFIVQKNYVVQYDTMYSEKMDLLLIVKHEVPHKHSEFKNEFSCNASLVTYKSGKVIDSIRYDKVEALGSEYGIFYVGVYPYKGDYPLHWLFCKEGDYDGRTILIEESGRIRDIKGGQVHVDDDNGMVLSVYSSDISGLTVYDLKSDSMIFEMPEFEPRPLFFYRDDLRYFASCRDDETDEWSIWEIEWELDRMFLLDLKPEDFEKEQKIQFAGPIRMWR